MARRAAGVVFVGVTLLGMLLSACRPAATSGPSGNVTMATPTATPGLTATPTVPPVPLSVYYAVLNTVYALNAANGSVRWAHEVSADVGIVQVADGMVYVITYGNKLTALRASDGAQVWQIATRNLDSPILFQNGVIYTGSDLFPNSDGYVDAYRASDGSRLWEYDAGSCSERDLAADDSAVYVSNAGCHGVLALRISGGSILWHSPVASSGGGMTVADGTVYDNNYTDVYALNTSDGKQLWHNSLPHALGQGGFAPAVGNGVVYVTTDVAIYALRADTGTQLWAKPGGLADGPVMDSSAVYFIPDGKTLDALDPTNGSTLWEIPRPQGYFGEPVAANGILYVMGTSATTDRMIYALHASDGSIVWQHPLSSGGPTSVAVG